MDAYNATAPNQTGARSYGLPPDLKESVKQKNIIEAIGIASCFLSLLTITILIRAMVYSYMTRRANTVLYEYSPTYPTATSTTTTTRPSKPLSSQSDINLQSVTLA